MIGRTRWALGASLVHAPELDGHESICVLDVNDETAHVRVTVDVEDRERQAANAIMTTVAFAGDHG